jgi:uncharacterized membrane protein
MYSGPLPPAQEMKQSNEAVPDCAERIPKMTELEQQHRHECNRKQILDNEKRTDAAIRVFNIGQKCAVGLAVLCIVGAIWLAYHDREITAGLLVTTTIGALFGALVLGRRSDNDKPDSDS